MPSAPEDGKQACVESRWPCLSSAARPLLIKPSHVLLRLNERQSQGIHGVRTQNKRDNSRSLCVANPWPDPSWTFASQPARRNRQRVGTPATTCYPFRRQRQTTKKQTTKTRTTKWTSSTNSRRPSRCLRATFAAAVQTVEVAWRKSPDSDGLVSLVASTHR